VGTSWLPWTSRESRPRQGPRAPPAASNRATSCWRWGSSRSALAAPCASPSDGKTRGQTSRRPSRRSRAASRACAQPRLRPSRRPPCRGRHRSRQARAAIIRRMSRIVAAMSGGVDSSVAAAMVAGITPDRGPADIADEVVGVWMRTHPFDGEGWESKRSCCSPDAAEDARRVAQILGIPFFVLNVEDAFGAQVIDAFADAYLQGATPNPCQACNQYIKFDELLRRGLAAYGADQVATGHYARIERAGDRWRLLRALDANKDQTYFLWVLTQEQLAATRFPRGELGKPQVREIAGQLGLPTATKPESQEICF